MCDTLCVATAGGMLFAKNSDRPVHEPQVVERWERRPSGGRLATQYIEVEDAGAHAIVGSRPTWLWGLEHGVNEYGLAVGNEKVWTVDDAHAVPPALLGMDLVRLALERGRSADEALEHLTTLLAQHGQGGSGEPDADEPYFSSFLLVDARGGWIVETSARTWAARPVGTGTSISNRISLSTDWTRASADVAPGTDFDRWRSGSAPTGIADHRLAATRACVAERRASATPRELVATMRHHGTRPWGAPGGNDEPSPVPTDVHDDWSGVTVCMHVRGYQATTASMVVELAVDGSQRAWACLGSPCAGVYVPLFPPAIPPQLGHAATWTRFERLRDRVEREAGALDDVRAVLAPVEADLWDEADACWATGERKLLARFAATAFAPVDAALRRLGV